MKLEIKDEKYNKFLKRKEIEAMIEHPEESTPSVASIQHLMAKQMHSSVDKTEIKSIYTSKGSSYSKCSAFIWDTKIVKDLAVKEEPVKKEGE
jgi:ribosomal protein S24E